MSYTYCLVLNQKFDEQLKKGEMYEILLLNHIEHIKYKKMAGNFKDYDLKIYHKKKRYNTYEVKTDYQINIYGNIAIEYKCYGKPSGISTSTARYWAIFETYKGGYTLYIIPRKIILHYIDMKLYHKDTIGGDNKASYLYLFSKEIFKKYIVYKTEFI